MSLNFEISSTSHLDLGKVIKLLPVWDLPVGWSVSESGSLLLHDRTGKPEMQKFPFEVTSVFLKKFIENWLNGRKSQLKGGLRMNHGWHISANEPQREIGIVLIVTKITN